MTTRELEMITTVGAGLWGTVAQITPTAPDASVGASLALLQQVATLSPSAILAFAAYTLWRRYTTREDKLSELQERNIAALQRVADALDKQAQPRA